MMDTRDANRLFAEMQVLWTSRPLNPDLPAILEQTLGDMPYGQCSAAVHAISRTGVAWAPEAGQIRLEAARLEVAPLEWDAVRQQLLRRRDELARRDDGEPFTWDHEPCGGTSVLVTGREAAWCDCRADYVAAMRAENTLDPLIRLWLDERFVTWDDIDRVATDTTAEAQVRKKWEAFADRMIRARVMRGLPNAQGSRALEQAREQDDRRIGQERRRSALRASLGAGTGADLVAMVGNTTTETVRHGD